jgi:hypothetical protein
LIVEDPDLPFYHVKQSLVGDDEETEAEGDEDDKVSTSKFVWPRDLVVARRIDSLCDLVLNPKTSSRQTRKRKSGAGTSNGNRKKTKTDAIKNDDLLSEEDMDEDEEDDDADEEDEVNAPSPAADDISEIPFEEPQPFAPEEFAAKKEEFVIEKKETVLQEPMKDEYHVLKSEE